MNKKVIIGLVIGILVAIIIAIGVCAFIKSNDDGLRFKREYEALNGQYNKDGDRYREISINRNNNVVYLTYDELVDFAANGTGLLFFGRPGCPFCRALVPTMLDFADEQDINIYYFNIEYDREANNERYQHILALFDEFLPTDTATQNEDDPDFNPNLKRVVLPHLFFLRDGIIKTDLALNNHDYLLNNDVENMRRLLLQANQTIAEGSGVCTINSC